MSTRLFGHQTRKHHDLDLVLLDFDRDEPRARAAVDPLGFRQISRSYASTRWMPSRSVMDDGAGRCIDLVNLAAEKLASTLGHHRHRFGDLSSDDGRSSLFVPGEIGGRRVVCLSADAQLLLHTAFDLRNHHKRDANLLQHTLCATHTPPAGTAVDASGRRDTHTQDRTAAER